MEFKNSLELKNGHLRVNDTIIFKINNIIYKYIVRNRYLENAYNDFDNAVIFEALNIKDPYDFCSKCYGYKNYGGMFPECNNYDYIALKNVAIALMNLCEEKSKSYDDIWK